ncbi:MAG: NfeD family protein [Candidatus Korobacteraceae bacterium]
MAWWMWLIVALLLLVGELITPGGFYLLFFGVAALAVGFAVLLGMPGPLWLHWVLFSATSVLALLFLRRPLKQRFDIPAERSNEDADTLVGEHGVAVEAIQVGALGRVELRGSNWQAMNRGAAPLTAGQRCVVERLQGLTLEVRPL